MNRCPSRPLARTLLVIATLGVVALAPLPASAQTEQRQFPATAKRGVLAVTQPPSILINGSPARLSPGARIKGVANTLVMPATLVGGTVLVNYVRDPQGMVHEVWILSELEAREERKGMEPVTNFTFASEADKPKFDDGKTPFDQLPKFPKQ